MLNRALFTFLVVCFSQVEAFAQVLGVPLYSWDFSAGLPSTWSNGSNSNIGLWEYRGPNTVPNNAITSRGSCAGGSSAFNSVTQSNGFMIFDSNYWDDNDNTCGGFGTGPDPGPHTAWLISNSFSLAGVTGAVVTFQQQFRNYSSTVKVQYSINGGSTWVDLLTQSNFPSATAEWKSATLPAAAIGQANVRLRFLYSGSYYHWAIDDITVYKPSINNLSINSTRYTTFGNTTPVPPNDFHDLPYDRYPKTMLVPFKFSAKSANIGSATQTNTNLNVKVLNAANTALYNQTSANSNVTAGSAGTYTLTTGYTPPTTTGYYRVTYQINQTQVDEAPLNNRDTLDYFVTDYEYARDEGPMEDEFTPSAFYAGQPYQVGNIFQGRSSTIKCTSVTVAVGPGTSIGTVIEANIYKTDFSAPLASSAPYTVNAWDINAIGQQKLITLPLTTPLTLTSDSLYVVMVGNTNGSQAFKVCRSGAAIDQTSFVRYPQSNGLFFMAKMPVVRMNLFTAAQTPGCMNPIAINYNASANIDDGSCDIAGCIYPSASNYNPNATWYDGSCVVTGCTNPLACNYNPIATVNNGTCVLPTTYFADSDGDTYGNPLATQSACVQPTGYVLNSADCNDNNASIRPNAAEICNSIDDNCNGSIDEGFAFTNYYLDSDSDGYGAGNAISSCVNLGTGYSTNNQDCNNSNANIRPNATEICNNIDDNCNGTTDEGLTFVNYYIDSDADGYGAGPATSSCIALGSNYVTNNLDCNNNNPNIKPTAPEICNSLDDNCNGLIDDGLTFQGYYADTDGDGYGAGTGIVSCSNPGAGYATNNTDCNNNNPNIRPNATEICNGIDDNCNNLIDDGLTFLNYYVDTDADGYGAGTATNSCTPLGSNYVTNNTDCNNNNPNIRPNATEICNGIDDNCNNLIDDGLTFLNYYVDTDADGYGAGTATNSCTPLGSNYVTNNTDCNNNNPNIRPNAVEICNSIDDNCNSSIDEGLTFVYYYLDSDGDGYGAGNPINSCTSLGSGYATVTGDCNNSNSNVRPGATEICNSIDDNCNNLIDEGLTFATYYLDADHDGYYLSSINTCSNPGLNYYTSAIGLGDCNDNNSSINSAATEICGNGIDENCDGNDPICIVPGCTNPIASNYNPLANLENGTCIILGCTIATANNFNPNANTNDGTCIFLGCIDPFANNFNPNANTNDYSCEYNTAAVSVSTSSLCQNQNVIAYNQTQYNSADSCSIDFGDGTVLNYCAPTYLHSYSNPGSYIVTLFHFQGTEFSTASTNPIQVNPNPTQALISYSYPELTISNYNQNEMSWIFNGTNTGITEQTINAVDLYSGEGFYKVISTNQFGCSLISDSIYFIIPKFDVFQENPCGPNTIVFSNITESSQNLTCHFENSNQPNIAFDAPYSYLSTPPESFSVSLVCTVFGNTYLSSDVGSIESYTNPSTPTIAFSNPYLEVTNLGTNTLNWIYQGISIAHGTIDSLNLTSGNGIQNGMYSVVFENEFGCISDTSNYFVLVSDAQSNVNFGCAPLSGSIVNNTLMNDGIHCEILLPGFDYTPIDSQIDFTFTDPGIYQPVLYCYAGTIASYDTLAPIQVYALPSTPALSWNYGQVNVTNNSTNLNLSWSLDGMNLNLSTSSISTLVNGTFQNGYYSVYSTDQNGCSSLKDSVLVIQPAFQTILSEGCAPLNAVMFNSTDPVAGMNCTINDGMGGVELDFNTSSIITYNETGFFAPEMTCSVGNISNSYSDTVIVVLPNPPSPILNATYGNVNCLNCNGTTTQFFLDNIPFSAGAASISTFQNGIYQNGYYSAQYSDQNGCHSSRDSILVIQPSFTAIQTDGCAPLSTIFTNTTDPVNGISCSINDGIGGPEVNFISNASLMYFEAGTFAPVMTCSVGNTYGTYSDTLITVHPNPANALLGYNNGFIQANGVAPSSNIFWYHNGNPLGNGPNPFDIATAQMSGYFYGLITNGFGCTAYTDTLLQIFPTFSLNTTSGCAPLALTATNETPSMSGMTCSLQTNGVDYPLTGSTILNYSSDGLFSTSILCSLDGQTFTANGPNVSVFPNAPAPQLSSVYGTVTCANCTGSTQYFLDNIPFSQGINSISTFQNGNYQNGYYTAQTSSAQGCLSPMSNTILVVQPVLNFSPSEGCAPLQVSFVNATDNLSGLSCELFLGNGNGNIPLSFQEIYDYTYTLPNSYSPYISCTIGNTVANSPSTTAIVHGGTAPSLSIDNGNVVCSNCTDPNQVTWIIDGTTTIDSTSSVSASIGNFFSCDYINEFGCTSNSFILENNEIVQSEFSIYPNPAREEITLTGLQASSTLQIQDAQGRVVYKQFASGEQRRIDIHHFSNGYYSITETSEKILRSGTLLVNH